MDKAKLERIGRRAIIAALVIAPPDAALVYFFWRWSSDPYATVLAGVWLAGLSILLGVFGYVAILSSRSMD